MKPKQDLSGKPIPESMDFFVNPDDSIGEILYGYSACDINDTPPSVSKKILVRAIGLIIGLIIGYIITVLIEISDSIDTVWYFVICISTGTLGFLLGKTGFFKSIFYVGTEGVQKIMVRKTRNNISQSQILLFKNATDLVVELIAKYQDRVYQGTNFRYKWIKINNGNKINVHELWGYFFDDQKTKIPSLRKYPGYYYAERAQEMWAKYIWPRYTGFLNTNGYVDFRVLNAVSAKPSEFMRLGFDFIELHWRDTIIRMNDKEIKDAFIQNGQLNFTAADFKQNWFKTSGKHILIPLSMLSNQLVFQNLFSFLYKKTKQEFSA